jgi:hypothetical protein
MSSLMLIIVLSLRFGHKYLPSLRVVAAQKAKGAYFISSDSAEGPIEDDVNPSFPSLVNMFYFFLLDKVNLKILKLTNV